MIETQVQCDELEMTPAKCKHTSTRLGSHRTESESINSLRRDSPAPGPGRGMSVSSLEPLPTFRPGPAWFIKHYETRGNIIIAIIRRIEERAIKL